MYAMEVVKPYKSKAKYIIVESIDINNTNDGHVKS